ncbi:MAG: carboxypeptidase regulatory-like domain-containing protein, partial [Acidobacteria bacterium]|nr:carboxypeptidase regulatory-like domain-containing protein [Acidobacteriota bacterium]
MERAAIKFLSLVLAMALGVAAASGQVASSRVTGLVTDKTGAVISGAKVTLTNEGTRATYGATTSASGNYVFDAIQIGVYTVTVEMAGFKRLIARGNVLTVGVPLTVNLELEVGGTQEEIEVVGSFERVQTSTSGNLGGLIDNKMLVDLPLGLESGTGGRNPLIFVRLQPGVNTGANTGGGSHVNGARDRAFNYTLDGIDINESSAGGSEFSPIRTNPDSLQELRVITSNATTLRDWGNLRSDGFPAKTPAERVAMANGDWLTGAVHKRCLFAWVTHAMIPEETAERRWDDIRQQHAS